jgi:hypothetical protein
MSKGPEKRKPGLAEPNEKNRDKENLNKSALDPGAR